MEYCYQQCYTILESYNRVVPLAVNFHDAHRIRYSLTQCPVLSSGWLGIKSHRTYKPDIKSETTYNDCYEFSIEADSSGNILCHMIVWDGDMCYGSPTEERCKFTVLLTEENLPLIRNAVSQAVRQTAIDIRERHEAKREERLMAKATKLATEQLLQGEVK